MALASSRCDCRSCGFVEPGFTSFSGTRLGLHHVSATHRTMRPSPHTPCLLTSSATCVPTPAASCHGTHVYQPYIGDRASVLYVPVVSRPWGSVTTRPCSIKRHSLLAYTS